MPDSVRRLRGWAEGRMATLAFLAAAVVVGAVLFSIVRGLTFLQDEWAFIGSRREFDLETVLKPHNEHWSSIPILVYQFVFRLRGLSSYGALAAVAALAHVFAALMLFTVLRSRAHPMLALAGGLGLLFLAWSDEVLLWPFSIGFTLAVAFGLIAILAWDRDRSSLRVDALGALAMVAALASAGVALVFLLVASAFLLARRAPPGRLLWPAACLVIYLAWFLTFGAGGIREGAGIDIATLPPFVASGIAALAAPLLGLDYRFRLVSVIALALVMGVAIGWLRFRDARFWIPILGLVAFYGFIGTARAASGGPEGAEAPRYIYPAAALAFLAIIPLIDAVRRAIPDKSQRLVWLGVAAWLLVAIAGDVGKLVRSAEAYVERAGQMRALLSAVEIMRPVLADAPPGFLVIDRRFFGGMTPSGIYEVVDDLTTPVPGATAASLHALAPQQRMEVDRMIVRLLNDGLVPRRTASAPGMAGASSAMRLTGLHDVDVAREGEVSPCSQLVVTGADPFFILELAGSERIWIRTDGQRVLQVFARVVGDVFKQPAVSFYPDGDAWYTFEPVPLPPGLAWTLRLDPPPGSSSFEVCLRPHVPAPS